LLAMRQIRHCIRLMDSYREQAHSYRGRVKRIEKAPKPTACGVPLEACGRPLVNYRVRSPIRAPRIRICYEEYPWPA
jgi:hypothetical protein